MSDIQAGGHELWVPVPLDEDPDVVHEALLARFGTDDATATHAAFLTGAARQLVQANATSDETMMLNLAAWALVSKPNELDVRGVATLRVAALEPDVMADEVIKGLASGDTLFEDPVQAPMDTYSGEALSVRLRPMVDEDGSTQVHEVAAVLWARPADSAWYILSTYTEDLVQAREIGELLDELGAGIEGL